MLHHFELLPTNTSRGKYGRLVFPLRFGREDVDDVAEVAGWTKVIVYIA